MKMIIGIFSFMVILTFACTVPVAAFSQSEQPASVVVMIPEKIDQQWFWMLYTETSQYFVQTAVEKALLRADVDILDASTAPSLKDTASLNTINSPAFARSIAEELGAKYVITGEATATHLSHDRAYGLNVFRSSASAMARIIRVSDGKMMALVDTEKNAGGQSAKGAGIDALKDAGKDLGRKLAREMQKLTTATAN